jgi:hypothetical protein
VRKGQSREVSSEETEEKGTSDTHRQDKVLILLVLDVIELARLLVGENVLDQEAAALLEDVHVDGRVGEEAEDLDGTKLTVAAK